MTKAYYCRPHGRTWAVYKWENDSRTIGKKICDGLTRIEAIKEKNRLNQCSKT